MIKSKLRLQSQQELHNTGDNTLEAICQVSILGTVRFLRKGFCMAECLAAAPPGRPRVPLFKIRIVTLLDYQ